MSTKTNPKYCCSYADVKKNTGMNDLLVFQIPKAVKLTNEFVELHDKYTDTIYGLMKETTKSGTPVNLPLWWLDPTDPIAHTIDSEYLLGEDLLVAPVLENGARQRDIYFPKGRWRDENDKSKPMIEGPTWVKNYPAPLRQLPHFSRDRSTPNTKAHQTVSTGHIILSHFNVYLLIGLIFYSLFRNIL